MSSLIDRCAVQDLVEIGIDALKLLVYYDNCEEEVFNTTKQSFIKRVGDKCR